MSLAGWQWLAELGQWGAIVIGGAWLALLTRELVGSRRLLLETHRQLDEILVELQVDRVCEELLESER